MKSKFFRNFVLTSAGLLIVLPVAGQTGSSRPRRVTKSTTRTDNSGSGGGLLDVVPTNGGKTTSKTTSKDTSNEPLLTPVPSSGDGRAREVTQGSSTTASNNAPTSEGNQGAAPAPRATPTGSGTDTTHAFSLLKLKQYEAAAKEAADIAKRDPTNSEAWKILGFAKYNLKQNGEAAEALQRALDLEKAASQEDPNTAEALARAYARAENYEKAFPLLVAATKRTGAKPDAELYYFQGIAAYQLKKPADAEKAFNEAVKADPKNAASLVFLGRIALEKNDYTSAISSLNRATLAEPRSTSAWALLMNAYMRKAAMDDDDKAKVAADYAGAVKAGEGLTKVKNDVESATLFAQALIQTQQFARAALVLDRFGSAPDASGTTLYLLGLSHSRAKNFPKAIPALERAAEKTPNDVNIFRELGYDYEASKQYAKALSAYQKGAAIAPDDAFFKDSIARVTPYAN